MQNRFQGLCVVLSTDSLSAPPNSDLFTTLLHFLYLPYSSAWQVKLTVDHGLVANRPQALSKKAGKKGQAAPAKTGGAKRNNKVAKVCISRTFEQ